MILVLEIVTVEDVPAGERPKLDEDLRLVVRPERRGVLLERIVHRRSTPIDLLNLVRFEVPAKFLYFPDENHWVLTPGNATVWYQTVFAFLAEHRGSCGLTTESANPD